MRLSEFVLANIEPILQAWEDFARTLAPGRVMTVAALRDDAERMLRFIAEDMETAQSPREQFLKSVGRGPQPGADHASAAQDHGVARAVDRFTLADLVSEYRALRASVLSLWMSGPDAGDDMQQVIRFNEAVDQLVAESVDRYSKKLDGDADIFTASIGHDLRNPLNAISMCAELLNRSGGLSDVEKVAVHQIAHSAVRMGTLLGELQQFSRVRLGGMRSFEREPTDVAGLCREVIEEIRASSPCREITLSQAGHTVASVGRERIGQLLSNLIGNAVQHGAPDRGIDVAIAGEDDIVRIDVRNEGATMPPEALKRIFEPLYSAGGTGHESRAHLGLGLYIARAIALAHEGDIGSRPRPGPRHSRCGCLAAGLHRPLSRQVAHGGGASRPSPGGRRSPRSTVKKKGAYAT
jgi:signal transduction histidine kinase